MAKIKLYQDKGYGGRVLELTDSAPRLSVYDFNDRLSSYVAESGDWILYGDADYDGDDVYMAVAGSSHPRVSMINFDPVGAKVEGFNDRISSVRLLPTSGICLFQHSYYRGRMLHLTESKSNLINLDFNDRVSSVIVLTGVWKLFQNVDFGGNKWTLGRGLYYNSDAGNFSNDSISSVQLQ